jgi:hypothetical protein
MNSNLLLQAFNSVQWEEPTDEDRERACLHSRQIIIEEEKRRVPELFLEDHPGKIYRVERNGIIASVIHANGDVGEFLSHDEQLAIRQFLFAQYINPKVGGNRPYYDPITALRYNLTAEPHSFFSNGDIHSIIGTADGQILGYLGVKGNLGNHGIFTQEAQKASHVLKVFRTNSGGNPYELASRSKELREVTGDGIREMRKFVIRQDLLNGLNLKGALVSAELALSLLNIADQFRDSVKILIGDTDPNLTQKNFEMFGIPVKFIEDSIAHPENLTPPYDMLWTTRYAERNVRAFILWIDEVNGQSHLIMNLINNLLNRSSNVRELFSGIRGFKKTIAVES